MCETVPERSHGARSRKERSIEHSESDSSKSRAATRQRQPTAIKSTQERSVLLLK